MLVTAIEPNDLGRYMLGTLYAVDGYRLRCLGFKVLYLMRLDVGDGHCERYMLMTFYFGDVRFVRFFTLLHCAICT